MNNSAQEFKEKVVKPLLNGKTGKFAKDIVYGDITYKISTNQISKKDKIRFQLILWNNGIWQEQKTWMIQVH